MLIGLATGDALGAPFEGTHKTLVSVREMYPGGLHARRAGDVTDDTLQAMAVAGSLIHCHGYCPEDLITRLIAGYSVSAEWYGPTSSAVFGLVRQGYDPYVAAETVYISSGRSRTNGGIMRGAPIGVAYTGPLLEKVSLSCSRLTHADPAAAWCSAFVNRMVSRLVRGMPKKDAWNDACNHCQDQEVLGMLGRFREYEPEASTDAVLSTHAAVWAFMTTGSFRDAVGTAASLGGDADTVAAVCGALAGSLYGIASVPACWHLNLQYRETLFLLARDLYSAFLPVSRLGPDRHVF